MRYILENKTVTITEPHDRDHPSDKREVPDAKPWPGARHIYWVRRVSVPQGHPRFGGLLGGLPGLSAWSYLTAMIYGSKRTQSQISKGAVAKSSGNQVQLPRVLSQRSHTGHAQLLQQQVMKTPVRWDATRDARQMG